MDDDTWPGMYWRERRGHPTVDARAIAELVLWQLSDDEARELAALELAGTSGVEDTSALALRRILRHVEEFDTSLVDEEDWPPPAQE